MKKVIVPFFISHQGCPHQCIFCDQRVISGASGRLPGAAEIQSTVTEWRRSAQVDSVEVAFYGGTFTALPLETQTMLLAPLGPLLRDGTVSAIRVSTRPDALDDGIIAMLLKHGVGLVELGIQSMDDRVLSLAGRGHTAVQSESAVTLLRRAGLRAGVQLMPGLPGDTAAGAIASLHRLLPLQPDLLRIYPAVVLNGTELARMYGTGVYQPLSLDEAVSVCKIMLQMAAIAGIPVIRVGLHPGDELTSSGDLLAGPYHPAFRQLAEGERWHDLLSLLCNDLDGEGELEIHVSPERVSDLVGHKRSNLRRLEAAYPVRISRVRTDCSLGSDEIVVSGRSARLKANIVSNLRYNNSMIAVKENA